MLAFKISYCSLCAKSIFTSRSDVSNPIPLALPVTTVVFSSANFCFTSYIIIQTIAVLISCINVRLDN
jgi:hypothetical protein